MIDKKEDIWKAVKETKLNILKKEQKQKCDDGLYQNQLISNVDKFKQHLSVNFTENPKRISEDNLTLALEAFYYLNSCSEFLEPWFSFYLDIFRHLDITSPDVIE